jgi:Protein of unknown function (DUF2950)
MRFLIHHVVTVWLVLVAMISMAGAQAPAQLTFPTPEAAATALLQALKTDDMDKLEAIFGPSGRDFASGDPVADRRDREVIALALQQSWRWASRGSNKKQLVIGDEAWPFPIPLAKKGSGWQFDTEAGKEEVAARRIGANELAVIQLCRAYVPIQKAYASREHDGKPAGIFAQKFQSTPGRQDGLYWKPKPGEPKSPLGDLAAQAAAEGYDREKTPTAPFLGYYFRILTAQGSAVPGGARSYVVDGDMSGGFALLAFPAKYDHSGVMTFIVNQNGVVYEKDLGPETSKLAGALTEYNPDKTWKPVRVR